MLIQFFILFLFSYSIYPTELIEFKNKTEILPITSQVEFFQDIENRFGFYEAKSSPNFLPIKKDVYFNPKPKGNFCFRLKLKNSTDEDVFLELNYFFLNKLSIYDDESNQEIYSFDKSKSGLTRESIFFRIPIIQKNQRNEKIFYIFLQTDFPLDISFYLGTNLKINEKEIYYYSIHYLFIGAVLVLILYNLFVYFSVQDKLYLYYIGILFFSSTTRLFINGFSILEILGFESYQEFYNYLLNWNSFTYIFITPFLIYYLELDQKKSLTKRILILLTVLLIIIFPILNVLYQNKFELVFYFQKAILVYFLYCIYILFRAWFDGNKNIKYVAFGWICFFGSVVVFTLMINGIIPYNFFSRNAPLFGIALEGIFFSFALGNRINILAREKKQLLEKEIISLKEKEQLIFENKILLQEQNRILELKVAERTLELEKKNDILEDMNEELNSQTKSLTESKFKLEQANHFKSIFLATMSHEIRTPINGILGISGILEEKKFDSETKEFIHSINYSARNLLLLVNDILDISKIEAGKLEIEKIPFDLNELISELEKTFIFSNLNKNLQFQIDKPNFPFFCLGDPNRIRQVLTNFISNAIKFTEMGSIQLKLTEKMIQPNEINILFEVIDQGIGISESNQKKLFKEYSQAEASTTRNFGGTGLGLSICKKLIELMKGTIGVKSELNKGSTFWFKLDFQTKDFKTELKEKNFDLNSKILIAEDNFINQKIALTFFKKLGFKIEIANNGLEVLEKVKSKNYDLIFMDCQMPNLDGYETTKSLREANYKTPIIALTADNSNSEKEKCLASGMNGFLSKPFTEIEIKIVLKEFLSEDYS